MKNLKVWQKLALIGLIFILPMLALVGLLARHLGHEIEFSRSELSGVAVADPLLDLVSDFQHLRALRHVAARGGDARAAIEAARTQALVRLDGLRAGGPLGAERWIPIERECRQMLAGDPPAGAPLAENARWTAAIESLLECIVDVADRSKLTLDDELATYYLKEILISEGPQSIEWLARARALSPAIVFPNAEPGREHVPAEIARLLLLSEAQQRRTEAAIDKAQSQPETEGARLSELRQNLILVSDRIRAEMRQLLDAPPLDAAPGDAASVFIERAERGLAQAYSLKAHVRDVFTSLLERRLERQRRARHLAIGLGGAGALLLGLFGVALMRDITRPIGALAAAAREIEAGNPDVKVAVPRRGDEIGELAEAFERMLSAEKRQRQELVSRNLEMLAAREEAVEAKNRAEAADRAKRDFLAVMSHEMRTPLNGILPVTELLAETPLDSSQRQHVRTIRSSAEHLLVLVSDVLDFSKIEAGRLELECVHFELRELLGETIQALAVRAAEQGIELNFHVKPDVPDDLLGDPHRLRQVIVNLAGNALKFTHEGEVNVLAELDGPETEDGVRIRFQVRDTGIGIAEDVRGRLFAAFEQGDRSTTRRYGGSGLGLAITKRLVEAMGGGIEVASEVGKGSTFSFTVQFQVAPTDFDVTQWNDLPRAKVLAVDDNATNRWIVRELLESWGLEVEDACDAASALRMLGEAAQGGAAFDLLITDLMMADVDGLGLVRRIRADAALRSIRVIMLASANVSGEEGRAAELDVAAFLTKPIRQAVLMDAIAEAFGCRRRSRHSTPIQAGSIPRQRPLRVLVAEDNATNQRIVRLLLESWGHAVVVAADGTAALDAFLGAPFDLVLMDSEMPRMGGIEATRAIRAREQGARRVPIIAMTANVIEGFREQCLDAGMDGYVSKPLRREVLVREMARHIPDLFRAGPDGAPPVQLEPALPAPVETPAPRGAPAAAPLFDRAALLAGVGGDPATLVEVLRLALHEDFPRLEAELGAAAEGDDLGGMQRAAHAIRGLVSELHASACQAAARALEAAAQSGDIIQAALAAAALQRELSTLREALVAHVDVSG
jgi:signal transduction histidine kinase/CheY-like chemotaxis protein